MSHPSPVSLDRVKIGGGFWGPRLRVNREVTLPIELRQCEETGRIGAFRLDWTPGSGRPEPHKFWDSDVAKWIEAVGYALATGPDADLRKRADEVIDLIAAAQQEDGYLNSYFTTICPDQRWTNLRDHHELYCAGHLMEAAVAYFRATGDRKLLDVMARYADHIAETFGPGENQKRGYPGHQEIELALVKLHDATGENRYLDLAKFFIDERGREPHYFVREAIARGEAPEKAKRDFGYWQAHATVREQHTAEGHAVRAVYLYAGMADVAARTGDADLLRACRALWDNITTRRMYVTGGIGSALEGERFTFDHDLPNESAYAETCAGIGLVFFAHRMLHAEPDGPDARYADVIERALYNNALGGVSLDGTRFFYANTLASHPRRHAYHGGFGPERQEWFGCACCPPNIARLLASLGQYIYSHDDDNLWVHLYVAGEAAIEVGGRPVCIEQATDYPWDGRITLRIDCDEELEFAVRLRLPGWCEGPTIRINGEKIGVEADRGYAVIRRRWRRGDTVELTLPMPVRRVWADSRIRHDTGRVALMRGPLVYCLEEMDNGPDLAALEMPRDAPLTARHERDLLGGVTVAQAPGRRLDAGGEGGPLYRDAPPASHAAMIIAVPYYARANRGPGERLVWIREGR